MQDFFLFSAISVQSVLETVQIQGYVGVVREKFTDQGDQDQGDRLRSVKTITTSFYLEPMTARVLTLIHAHRYLNR